jgi:hypothetical protein
MPNPISMEGMECYLLNSKETNVVLQLNNFMKKLILSTLIGGSLAILTLAATANTVVVPGSSDPWLAGQTTGTTASGGDVAPAQSPVYAGSVTAGSTITWSASGLVYYQPGIPSDGPNGQSGYIIDDPAQNGIAGLLNVQLDALVGVFLGSSVPSGAAPASLDFSTIGLTYTSLSPGVDQPFYMGDGSVQSLVVPAGATRLFLGTVDGFGWYNNVGAFDVTLTNVTGAVPDAGSTLTMLGVAFGLVGVVRRKIS